MTDVAAVVARAQALETLGRGDDAATLVEAELSRDPHNAELLGYMSVLLCSVRRDFSGAYAAAQAAIREDPRQAQAFLVLSFLYRETGLADKALAAAREAVRLKPLWPAAHVALAEALVDPLSKTRRAETRAALAEALRLDPYDADLHAVAARLERAMVDPTAAEAHTAAGLLLDPRNTELLTLQAGGEPFRGGAVQLLRGVLEREPSNVTARRALADLVWGAIARLASSVWVFVLAVVLLSMWISPDLLAKVKIVLFAPLVFMWSGVFIRLRRTLPPGYFRSRVLASPPAWGGLIFAFLAALLANLGPALLTLAHSSSATRGAYSVMLFACLLASVGHVLVHIGRDRPIRGERTARLFDRETAPAQRADDMDVTSITIAIVATPLLLLLWPLTRWASQPGALWVAIAVVVIAAGTWAFGAWVLTLLYVRAQWVDRLVSTILLIAALAVGCRTFLMIAGYDFGFAVPDFVPHLTPIRLPQIDVPTFLPPPPAGPGN